MPSVLPRLSTNLARPAVFFPGSSPTETERPRTPKRFSDLGFLAEPASLLAEVGHARSSSEENRSPCRFDTAMSRELAIVVLVSQLVRSGTCRVLFRARHASPSRLGSKSPAVRTKVADSSRPKVKKFRPVADDAPAWMKLDVGAWLANG